MIRERVRERERGGETERRIEEDIQRMRKINRDRETQWLDASNFCLIAVHCIFFGMKITRVQRNSDRKLNFKLRARVNARENERNEKK